MFRRRPHLSHQLCGSLRQRPPRLVTAKGAIQSNLLTHPLCGSLRQRPPRLVTAIHVIQSNMLTRPLCGSLRQRPPRSLVILRMTALRSCSRSSPIPPALRFSSSKTSQVFGHTAYDCTTLMGRHFAFKKPEDTSVSSTSFFTR